VSKVGTLVPESSQTITGKLFNVDDNAREMPKAAEGEFGLKYSAECAVCGYFKLEKLAMCPQQRLENR
jgi:hypothetical protein